ncbi:class I SAM-dependent methyltransferase [Chromobacterium vaccinii]|uniref:class I SAM-dependent methyltransferase n=1 Tax=Chromobacterium vaccinii TaxID=1108595 RepID=UPI0009F1D4D7|nr:class I SAM-dependent methyltransferase [Chromobacterium vaccinii]
MQKVNEKTYAELAKEWDEIADKRYQQMANGIDNSYDKIITPFILDSTNKTDLTSLIDAGCGNGILLSKIESHAKASVGIDISKKNISIARNLCKTSKFDCCSIEEFSKKNKKLKATTIICCMVLMDTPSLTDTVSALSRLLKKNGNLIWVITHPFFWPRYWGYENEDWFKYSDSIPIEAFFKISNEETTFKTTHTHHPLWKYINTFHNNGLSIETISELMPIKNDNFNLENQPNYPRFLAGICRKLF